MDADSFRDELSRLVAAYTKNRHHFVSSSYDESSLRNDFLTPFWRALGWDVENKKGLTQLLREVQVESRIDEQGAKKRADYLFRTDGIDRFVCEAKKPSVDLKRYAYQAQRYAFNLRLLLTTLSSFESLHLFIVGGKPDPASTTYYSVSTTVLQNGKPRRISTLRRIRTVNTNGTPHAKDRENIG